ncbi:MAG TPA: cofactor-independent phosphoglycerate mutase [Clostridia bacterium]|nr:cofactor-independent phosphoglycerate mutase [Clostridia bacterium]
MKYITILVDGMADYPIDELDGKTPLEAAEIPSTNSLARRGEVGMVKTVPDGMAPGSDVANLALMGYEPEIYHTGRSPLEAASMGVELSESDVAFRCNLVSLSGEGALETRRMLDHSAGEISNEEARELITLINEQLGSESLRFYPGVSYRHLLVWKDGPWGFELTPPHDILGQGIADYLPGGAHGRGFTDMTARSLELLETHPINLKRKERGENPANSIWIWGEGKRPQLSSFQQRYGLKGAVISAVDLIYGIGILSGLEPIHVEGATGNIHTNFDGKASAAIEALSGDTDYVYLHLEAPDESGHQGSLKDKIRSMELIDQKVVAPIHEALADSGQEYRILILPDHPTPISLRTHVAEPVPYVLYDSRHAGEERSQRFSEASGKSSGCFFSSGPELIRHYLSE